MINKKKNPGAPTPRIFQIHSSKGINAIYSLIIIAFYHLWNN